MERQSSRRRKPLPSGKDPSRDSDDPAEPNNKKSTSLETKFRSRLLILSLILLFAIFALFFLIYYSSISENRILAQWLPVNLRNESTALQSTHDFDDVQFVNINLHPEEHIYRDAAILQLEWRVSAGQRRPDGVLKRMYLINGDFPGPTIEARSGDTLVLSVHNDLEDEPISIHWHGLYMRNANAMDGVIGVTQCGILPGETFIYNFTISPDQSGTFWYHAHSAMQRADGLYGGLVVHRPAPRPMIRGLQDVDMGDSIKYGYEEEIMLLVGDWYHRSAAEVSAWYFRAGSFGNELTSIWPVPDSMLVNGVGRFNCSKAVPARPVDCIEESVNRPHLVLDEKTTYRIRVVNTGSLAGFTLAFDQETLEIIQLDGGIPVDSGLEQNKINSAGVLFPGQRMDLILHTPAERRNREKPSLLTVDLDQGCFKYPNPALTPRHMFPIVKDSSSTKTYHDINNLEPKPDNGLRQINIEKIPSASTIRNTIPAKAQQTHIVYTKIEKLSRLHNVPYGFFNRTTWKPQADPPTPLIGLPRNQWDKHQFGISIASSEALTQPTWVDLVVNNLDEGSHPFHLHGHNFFIIALHESSFGWGSYNPFLNTPDHDSVDVDPYDLSRAVLRDTVQIPRRGYAVLRFRADNPGVWLFHCHILWHLAGGMAMVVDVTSSSSDITETGNRVHQPSLEGVRCRV